MKKIIILLVSLFLLTSIVSCKNEEETLEKKGELAVPTILQPTEKPEFEDKIEPLELEVLVYNSSNGACIEIKNSNGYDLDGKYRYNIYVNGILKKKNYSNYDSSDGTVYKIYDNEYVSNKFSVYIEVMDSDKNVIKTVSRNNIMFYNALGEADLNRIGEEYFEAEELYLFNTYNLKNIDELKELSNLKELYFDFTLIDDLSAISNLMRLEKIKILSCEISDLSPIRNLSNLKYIDIYSDKLNSIKIISEFESLEYLGVGGNRIDGLGNLSTLHNLKYLVLSGGVQVDDGLNIFTNLESLVIANTQSISKFPNLHNLKKLNTLTISNCINLKDISEIKNIPNLMKLQIDCNDSMDISPISEYNLSELYINLNQNTNISPLLNLATVKKMEIRVYCRQDAFLVSDLSSLEELTIYGWGFNNIEFNNSTSALNKLVLVEVPLDNLNIVNNCPNLKYLVVGQMELLRDISAISNATKLEFLQISDCLSIKNLNVIKECRGVKYLGISGMQNLAKDFSFIEGMNTVESLYFFDCNFNNTTLLETLPKLKSLYFDENDYLDDIISIKEIESLERLYLYYNTLLKDISPVAEINNLDYLLLSPNYEVSSLLLNDLANVEVEVIN